MELKDFTDLFSLFNALFTLLLPCLENLTFMLLKELSAESIPLLAPMGEKGSVKDSQDLGCDNFAFCQERSHVLDGSNLEEGKSE